MTSKESALCTCLRKEFGIFSIGIASMYLYSQTSSLKPGSHMPPTYLRQSRRYCLGYCSDIWEHYAAGNKIYRRSLPPACLTSWTRVNFAGMTAVLRLGWSLLLATSVLISEQVGRRHMRTRLYLSLWGWNPCYILARTIDFYYLN